MLGPMAIIVFQHEPTGIPGRLGRVLRDCGKVLDVRRLDLPTAELGGPMGNRHVPDDFDEVEGVIALGGYMNVTDDPAPGWMAREMAYLKEAHARKLPLIGICLGHQMIAKALGGEVGPMDNRRGEQGMVRVRQHPVANTDVVLAGVPWNCVQFQSHQQEVKVLPPGGVCLQFSDMCKVQSFRVGLRTYGFQYHFECDWAMVWRYARSMGVAEGGAGELAAMKAHFAEYERVSERLCSNIASVLMPVTRRYVA